MKIKPTSEKAKSAPKVSSRSHLGERVPRLRFPGFEGEWEEQCLETFMYSRDERQIPSPDAPLMAFIAKLGVAPKGERYDREYLVKSKDKEYKRTEFNDFIYSSNNLDVGSIGLNKYGRAVISDVYEIFTMKDGYAPEFISELVQRPRNLHKVLRFRQGCLYGQYRIYASDFLSVKLLAPDNEEQFKIAGFLQQIDTRITAQRRLVELLKKHKRGLLRYVFEENIEGDYYSFSEIASRRNEKITPTKDSRLDCIELENIEQETGMLLGSVPLSGQNSLKNLCKPSDIVFGKLRPYLRKFVFAENECAVSSETWVLVAAKGIYPKFLFYLIQSEPFMRAASVSSGTKMPRSEWSNVANAKFYVPDRTQQETIAACFSEIDRRILTSQRILTAAQAYKRGLLQQLFV